MRWPRSDQPQTCHRDVSARSTQYADNLSWTHGRHSFLFGAEHRHLTELAPFPPNYNGAYTFASVTPTATVARLAINNAPSAVAITGGDPLLLFLKTISTTSFRTTSNSRSNLTSEPGHTLRIHRTAD